MPRLLPPDDQARWLDGDTLLSLGRGYLSAAYYRENLGELWAKGQLPSEAPSLALAAA